MRPFLLLVFVAITVAAEDYESFKLKDGRVLDGEYIAGNIVMLDGKVSVPVPEADIVYRVAKARPSKKVEDPARAKAASGERAPAYAQEAMTKKAEVEAARVALDRARKEHGDRQREASDALQSALTVFFKDADLSPVPIKMENPTAKDLQDAQEIHLLNERMENCRERRERKDQSVIGEFRNFAPIYAKYKNVPWLAALLKDGQE